MAETLQPLPHIIPARPARLADPPGTMAGTEVLVEIEVSVENGVLPPSRAPAVKQPAPAAPSQEEGKEQPKPVETARPAD